MIFHDLIIRNLYFPIHKVQPAAISFHWIKMKELFKNCDYDYEYDLHSNYEREVCKTQDYFSRCQLPILKIKN